MRRLKEAWVWTKATVIALTYGAALLLFAVYLGVVLAVGAVIRSLRVDKVREEVFGDVLEIDDDG